MVRCVRRVNVVAIIYPCIVMKVLEERDDGTNSEMGCISSTKMTCSKIGVEGGIKRFKHPCSNEVISTDVILKVIALFYFCMVEGGDCIFWEIIN